MNNILINGYAETLNCKYCGKTYTSRGKNDPGYCKDCEREHGYASSLYNGNEDVIWKEVEGFDGYYVNQYGEVLGLKGKILKPNTSTPYNFIGLHKNGKPHNRLIHRLVAKAFIPNPDNLPEVNHKDENKRNNYFGNLEWCTSQYNTTYGKNPWKQRQKVAEDRAKPVDMIEDGRVIARYASIREASRITGVNRLCISRCCNGTTSIAGGYTWRFSNEQYLN